MRTAWRTVGGNPIASKASSTPPAVISTTRGTGFPSAAFTPSVAPRRAASSSFQAAVSTATMRPAPAMRQP